VVHLLLLPVCLRSMKYIFFPVMIKQINKYNKLFALILLGGYVSFLVLTIAHIHIEEYGSNEKKVRTLQTNCYNLNSETQKNCQICQLYSSSNVNPVFINPAPGKILENCLLLSIDKGYKSTSLETKYLRGPPANNILFI
jgi:hypothetical protein